MPFFKHPDVMNAELSYIRENCNRMVLVSTYTVGDSYATVNANVLAEFPMLSSDFTLGASGNNRTLTVAPKSDASANASGGGVNSHTVLLDTFIGRVLFVTEESAAQSITVGSPVSIGGFVITNAQPIFG